MTTKPLLQVAWDNIENTMKQMKKRVSVTSMLSISHCAFAGEYGTMPTHTRHHHIHTNCK
jgi:hypothetical protein